MYFSISDRFSKTGQWRYYFLFLVVGMRYNVHFVTQSQHVSHFGPFIHSFIYMDDGAVGGAGGGDVPSPAASVAVPVLTTGGPELNTCSTTVLKELHWGH